jgi:hypothetical protein
LDETLSATSDIDSLLQGPGPMDDMFPADLGAPTGGLLGDIPAVESPEGQPAPEAGEQAAEQTEEAAEGEKKPSRLAVLLEKFDIYTSLLAVSLLAMLLGCLFLWIEWGRYLRDTKAKTAKTHGGLTASSVWSPPRT